MAIAANRVHFPCDKLIFFMPYLMFISDPNNPPFSPSNPRLYLRSLQFRKEGVVLRSWGIRPPDEDYIQGMRVVQMDTSVGAVKGNFVLEQDARRMQGNALAICDGSGGRSYSISTILWPVRGARL